MYGLKILTEAGLDVINTELPIFEVRYKGTETNLLMSKWWENATTRQELINQGYDLEGCLEFLGKDDGASLGANNVIVGPPTTPAEYGIKIMSSSGDLTLSGERQILQVTRIVNISDWVFHSDVAYDSYVRGFRKRTYRVPLDGATYQHDGLLSRPYVHNHDNADNPYACGFGYAYTDINVEGGYLESVIEYRARAEEVDRNFCDLVTNINLCINPTVLLAKLSG